MAETDTSEASGGGSPSVRFEVPRRVSYVRRVGFSNGARRLDRCGVLGALSHPGFRNEPVRDQARAGRQAGSARVPGLSSTSSDRRAFPAGHGAPVSRKSWFERRGTLRSLHVRTHERGTCGCRRSASVGDRRKRAEGGWRTSDWWSGTPAGEQTCPRRDRRRAGVIAIEEFALTRDVVRWERRSREGAFAPKSAYPPVVRDQLRASVATARLRPHRHVERERGASDAPRPSALERLLCTRSFTDLPTYLESSRGAGSNLRRLRLPRLVPAR